MCVDAKNHTLPVAAAQPMTAGRSAFRAWLLLSILVHGAVISGAIWGGQPPLTSLSMQGGGGTMIVLIGGNTPVAIEMAGGMDASPLPAVSDTDDSEMLLMPVQETAHAKATEDAAVKQGHIEKRAPLAEQKKVTEPKKTISQRQIRKVESPREAAKSKPQARQTESATPQSFSRKAAPAMVESRGAAVLSQKTKNNNAGSSTGERAGGMQSGQASGIGNNQGSGMGATQYARFGMDVGPSFVRFSRPEYPASARRRGISGLVVLRVLISAEGRAERIEVVSSVDASLSRSACTAVRNAIFAPYRPGGRPVACWTELPIRFHLEHRE